MNAAPSPIRRQSTVTCPACGHAARETMPADACVWFHRCPDCGTVLTPRAGDCCVFCSFGDVPCPPVQEARARGEAAACCSESAANRI